MILQQLHILNCCKYKNFLSVDYTWLSLDLSMIIAELKNNFKK